MKRNWSDDELQEFWSLSPDELALLPSKSAARRLGFALQLKFLQIQGQFPDYRRELPALAFGSSPSNSAVTLSIFPATTSTAALPVGTAV